MSKDDRVLFTVTKETADAAIRHVASCEACNPVAAETPFEWLLDDIMQLSGVHTHYFLPEPPSCPKCGMTVTENTLIEWNAGVIVDAPVHS